jgi:hypothetical protein
MATETVLIPLAGLVRPTPANAEIINDPMVERFSFLFAGRTDVWGALHGQAIKEAVTLTHYRNHLAGKTSLGIYPLTAQGLVRWFAIDIDKLDPALALRLLAALCTLGLSQGVYLERSKGKGFHIIILLSDWVLAIQVRRIAKAALSQAGLPATTEIFPKQDRLTNEIPWGNYLNLPYFAGDNPEGRRMVVDPTTLTPLPLRIWLEEVKPFPVEPSLPLPTPCQLSPRQLRSQVHPKLRPLPSSQAFRNLACVGLPWCPWRATCAAGAWPRMWR